MQNSKKRTKQLITGSIIAIGVLALVLGLLYFNSKKDNEPTKVEQKVIVDKGKAHYGKFVSTTKKTNLYIKDEKKFNKIGNISKHMDLQLDPLENKKQEYYKIKDSEYYVFYQDVVKRELFEYKENYQRYLPFNENVITKDKVNLYDENGKVAYTLNQSIDASVYVKKNDMNYIAFNHDLYGIKKEDIKEVRMNQNSDQENATRVPVFMYHFFYDEKAGEVAKDNNFTEVHKFREELTLAKELGYQSITMDDLELYLDGAIRLPQKSFVVSMDDNAESVKRLAYPVLEETQTYATNFVISAWTQDFKSIQSKYIELQSHSDNMHEYACKGMGRGGRMMCIPYEEGVKDLQTSSQKLYNSNVFCYPFGDYNDEAKRMLRDTNFTMAFTVEFGYTKPGMDKLQLPRVRISNSTSVASFIALLEG